MEIYDLGRVPWHRSQLVYHALARLGREAICICSPISPYFCLGFHQDIDQEVDLAFCADNNIPVFRREVGGGGVFLDSNQVFFQLILHRRSPHVTMCREAFYRKFLEPVVRTYQSMGIPAHYEPIADLVVENRKICGTGAGEIGESVVFVGNIIMDFDFDTMAGILTMPDERFRVRVRRAMEENMTTVRRELGEEAAAQWGRPRIAELLVSEFERLLGSLVPRQVDCQLNAKMAELAKLMSNNPRRRRNGKRGRRRIVTIRSGLQLCHDLIETSAGMVSVQFEIRDGKSARVAISGEACQPFADELTRLESSFEGIAAGQVRIAVTNLFAHGQSKISGLSRTRR